MSKNRSRGENRANKNKKRIHRKSKKLKKAKVASLSSTESHSLGVESKLSESILEFGKPLIEKAESVEQEKYAIEISVLLWNVSVLSSSRADGVKKIKKIIEELQTDSTIITSGLLASFDLLYDRKVKYFGNDKRVALNHSLQKTDKGFYLQVASGKKPWRDHCQKQLKEGIVTYQLND